MSARPKQTGPIIFVPDVPTVEPLGELVQLEIAGQFFVMGRHNLLVMLHQCKLAYDMLDAERPGIVRMERARRAEKAVTA